MAKVLVIDDDEALCELLKEYLEQEGHDVVAAGDGESGLREVHEDGIEIVVLDVMLPGLSGFEVLKKLRAASDIPVLMLTARGEEVDRIVGLELGADDYLPKPFNPRELAARMRAVLRRARVEVDDEPRERGRLLEVGDIVLDLGARTAVRAGAEVFLTGLEFSLLEAFLRSAGEVVRREELYRKVLGRRAAAFDRSLDVHVSNLRRKLGPLEGGRERIKTVRGAGYQYVLEGR